MDLMRREILLEKYWAGETSPEEESELRKLFESAENIPRDETELLYFQKLEKYRQITLAPSFEEKILREITTQHKVKRRIFPWPKVWGMAASIVLVVSLAMVVYPWPVPKNTQVSSIEEDPEKAWEFTKQSLRLISSKLNEGAGYTMELSKFNQTLEKIQKQEN